MSEPDEAMVEAVARAINAADNAWADAPRTMPHEVWPTHVARAALSVPVVRDALARDAQVRADAEIEWGVEVIPGEIRWVSEAWLESGGRPKANGVLLPVYRRTVMHGPWVLDAPSPGDRDDSEEQR